MVDAIADMLTRIRNAQAVNKETVEVPYSKMRLEVAKVLERTKFVKSVEAKGRKERRYLEIVLGYDKKIPAITGIKKISKSGQRIYTSFSGIQKVKSGIGISIISTSKGLMTGGEARKQHLGGEIICEVW